MRSDLLWVTLGRIATALIAIANIRIMTSFLTPENYGVYTLLIAFQGFCGLVLINPLGQHINRNTHLWWDDDTLIYRLKKYNKYLITVSVLIVMIVTIWWLNNPEVGDSVRSALLAAIAVGGMIFLGTWNGTHVQILNMLDFRSDSVVVMLLSLIAGLFFSTILASQFQSASSWIFGQVLGMAIGALLGRLIVKRRTCNNTTSNLALESDFRLIDRQTVITYCLPLAVATSLMWLQNAGYRFWVGKHWGVTELGMLAVGLGVSLQIWTVIETLSMQLLSPYFFRHITGTKTLKEKSQVLSDMVNLMWPIYAVFAGFSVMFALSILTILTDLNFHAASKFMFYGILVEFARCTSNLWSYAAQIERRTVPYMIPYGLGASTLIVGAFIANYFNASLEVMAIVLTASACVTSISMIVSMQKLIPVKLDLARWITGTTIMLGCIIVYAIIPDLSSDLIGSIYNLVIGFLVVSIVVIALTIKSSALKRLMSVSPRGTTK